MVREWSLLPSRHESPPTRLAFSRAIPEIPAVDPGTLAGLPRLRVDFSGPMTSGVRISADDAAAQLTAIEIALATRISGDARSRLHHKRWRLKNLEKAITYAKHYRRTVRETRNLEGDALENYVEGIAGHVEAIERRRVYDERIEEWAAWPRAAMRFISPVGEEPWNRHGAEKESPAGPAVLPSALSWMANSRPQAAFRPPVVPERRVSPEIPQAMFQATCLFGLWGMAGVPKVICEPPRSCPNRPSHDFWAREGNAMGCALRPKHEDAFFDAGTMLRGGCEIVSIDSMRFDRGRYFYQSSCQTYDSRALAGVFASR